MMPLAQITLTEGTTDDQKRKLLATITDAFEQSLGTPRDAVRVIISEVPTSAWAVGGVSVRDRQAKT